MSDKDFPLEPTDGRPLFDLDAWTETRSVTMPQAELDTLRAEVEQLKDEVLDAHLRCVYEVRESQAEVERLREERAKREADFEPLLNEILQLRAEVERLRAFVGRVVGAYAVDEWIAEEGQRLLDEKVASW